MLDVRDLTKRFGGFTAVKDLTFQVKRGEVFGFLGPNGAGKTTTMRIVTCFIPATEGKIEVAGIDTTADDLEIRKKLGYLPENNPLYNDMLVLEYLKFVGELRGLGGSRLNSRIDEMFQVCGLTKMAYRQIGKLSKGYRQRVGLAQAMIHDPELLILDEPMSGLDPNQIVEIRSLIKKLGREKTVIYCSHILSEVSATCSRILIINDGRPVATGTAEELTSRSTSGNRYFMRLRGDKTAIEGKLPSVAGVSTATVEADAGDYVEARVVSEHNDDIGEALFQCAVNNGWSLAELRRETASLEDVFTQLTRG
ncbi:MAG: ATP-binding cassette domain-containing protein [Chitinivibrionales bacterium]|nr:ATP-binding cassette domain-containing protein [Chitinivibrionales bacterium]MBD3356118.1 ATP-binding cassette domain-containing protein [Chitinivibrionales bacterium]